MHNKIKFAAIATDVQGVNFVHLVEARDEEEAYEIVSNVLPDCMILYLAPADQSVPDYILDVCADGDPELELEGGEDYDDWMFDEDLELAPLY